MKNALNTILFFSTLSFSGWTFAEGGISTCSVSCPDGTSCSITGYNVSCYCNTRWYTTSGGGATCTSGKKNSSLSNPLDIDEGLDGINVVE